MELLLEEVTVLSEHGDVLFSHGRYDEAKAEYERALRIFSQLGQTDERGGDIGMTMQLNNIGMCLGKLGRQEEALQVFLDAISRCRPHWRDTPDALASLLAAPTLSAASLLAERGDLHRAIEFATETVHLCRASVQPGPLALDSRLARALRLCAMICGAQNHDLERALSAATEALTIFQHLAHADQYFLSELPLSYSTFAGVLDRLGRHTDAAMVREKTGIAGPPWREGPRAGS